MRSPSIVPEVFDTDVYLVLDDSQEFGRAYRENEMQADGETLVQFLKEGQFNNPVRIVAFNTAGDWSKDVTEEIAQEIQDGADRPGGQLPPGLRVYRVQPGPR
jgi:hypothetical protein